MNAPRWAATAALVAALLLGGHGLAQAPAVSLPTPAASAARPADALRQGLRGALNAAAAPLLQQAASAVPGAATATSGSAKPLDALKAAATAAAASAATSALSRAPAATAQNSTSPPGPASTPDAAAPKPASPAARAEAFAVPEPAPPKVSALSPEPGTGTALQLNYTTVTLPSAREGETYGPRALVVGGGLGMTAEIAPPGQLPPGLTLQTDGQLGGRPATGSARTWRFTLEVRDGTGQLLRQAYTLTVLPPRATGKPSAPVVSRALKSYRAAELEPGPRNGSITTYVLKADALDAVLQSWADTSLTPGVRHAELPDLENMYNPLVGVEFPTLALFDAALRDRQCVFWLQKYNKAVSDRTAPPRSPVPDCSDVAAEPVRPAPAGMQSLKALYDSYLPEELQRQLRDAAREIRWLDPRDAPPPAEAASASATAKAAGKTPAIEPQPLVSTACGCVHWPSKDDVIGLVPFWQDTSQSVELARLQRLQMFAAVLQDDGSLAWPAAWTTSAGLDTVALEARRHDTKLDLVVHRQLWRALLDSPNPEPFIKATVETLRKTLEQPAPKAWPRGLTHVWGEAERLYDGLVLWFEPEEGASDEAFQRVYQQIVIRLHQAMVDAKRPLQLTLVVPDAQFGTTGTPFALGDLVAYLEGEFKQEGALLVPKAASDRKLHYEPQDRGQLRVRLMVLLQEPTRVTKKSLRARIDQTTDVRGARRVFLNERIAPLARLPFPPLKDEPSPGSQFDDDIAYHQWVFQGVALWPLPQGDSGERVMKRIAANFEATFHWSEFPVVCDFVCPRRNGLHLLMETLLVLCGVALVVWRFTDWAQSRGRWARVVLLLPPIASTALAYALLSCDPGLRELRQSWMLPALIILAVLLPVLWAALARRVTPP